MGHSQSKATLDLCVNVLVRPTGRPWVLHHCACASGDERGLARAGTVLARSPGGPLSGRGLRRAQGAHAGHAEAELGETHVHNYVAFQDTHRVVCETTIHYSAEWTPPFGARASTRSRSSCRARRSWAGRNARP